MPARTMTRPPVASRWLWVLVVMLAVAEFLVFDRMTSRYHTRVYPRWTDQPGISSERCRRTIGFTSVPRRGLILRSHEARSRRAG